MWQLHLSSLWGTRIPRNKLLQRWNCLCRHGAGVCFLWRGRDSVLTQMHVAWTSGRDRVIQAQLQRPHRSHQHCHLASWWGWQSMVLWGPTLHDHVVSSPLFPLAFESSECTKSPLVIKPVFGECLVRAYFIWLRYATRAVSFRDFVSS